MARVHGFRIYTVQAFENQRKDKEPLDVSGQSRVRRDIEDLLERIHSGGTQFFAPPPPVPPEPAKSTTTITVHEPVVISRDLIHVSVAMGETGSHRLATRANEDPRNLEDWSPEADYAMTFVFPRGKETRFLLVAQTIHRRDPHLRLLSMLAKESAARRDERRTADKAARASARERGEQLPEAGSHYKLLFDEHQSSDNEYLDSILATAKQATATFKGTRPSSRGSNKKVIERTLSITLRDNDVTDIGRPISQKWSRLTRRGESVTPHEGVSELGAMLHGKDLFDESEGERYESASISVRGDGKETTTIAVDTLHDAFTYPVSDGTPSMGFHYDRVAERVAIIARQERLEVGAFNGTEVEECLKDSTQGP